MKLLKQLRNLLRSTDLSYEEVKAFEVGLSNIPIEDQIVLYRIFNENPDLIYPSYINYKAKLKAAEEGIGFDEAVEKEIAELDKIFSRKKFDSGVKKS